MELKTSMWRLRVQSCTWGDRVKNTFGLIDVSDKDKTTNDGLFSRSRPLMQPLQPETHFRQKNPFHQNLLRKRACWGSFNQTSTRLSKARRHIGVGKLKWNACVLSRIFERRSIPDRDHGRVMSIRPSGGRGVQWLVKCLSHMLAWLTHDPVCPWRIGLWRRWDTSLATLVQSSVSSEKQQEIFWNHWWEISQPGSHLRCKIDLDVINSTLNVQPAHH